MNFKLGWMGRILLVLLYLVGGCIYNQKDVDAGTPVMADIRAHDYNPYYVYAEYPEIWPLINDSAGLLHGVFALGSPNAMLLTEPSHPAWVYEDTLRNRMYPEWIGRYILENNLEYLLRHVPFDYKDQADLVSRLRELKRKKFAIVKVSACDDTN